MIYNKSMTALLLIALAACSNEPDNDTVEAEPSVTKPRQEHVLQTQMDQIDKARALQDQLNTAAEDRLKQIDENTQRQPDDG